ncbi:MAG: hypothetical protein HWE30_18600 [Methylocystaceae bacterium]|nr:hypothetical protein [Methylocystaceae bacterium]
MDGKKIAEFAFDLQNGLGRVDAPEYFSLREIGMAASLAIHIKGLQEIEFEVLRKVSDFFFSINSHSLRPVLEILEEIGFVKLITDSPRNIKTVIPTVPHFDNLYSIIGDFAKNETLNEIEQATLHILNEIQKAPENKDRLLNSSGIEKGVFSSCIKIGTHGGLIREHRARGRDMLVSPIYFADNLDGLADLAVQAGSTEIQNVLNIIKKNQGWPLSFIETNAEIGGVKLTTTQQDLIYRFSTEGILKPPKISWAGDEEHFIFTPKPGNGRLNASNREVYERAMALVSAVRKGQLRYDQYKIISPLAILRSFRNKGYIRQNSEAYSQYLKLVQMKVAKLVPAGENFWRVELIKEPENEQALNLAIQLLETGEMADLEIDREAIIALSKDERYVQSLISARELRAREKALQDEQATYEWDQLVMRF